MEPAQVSFVLVTQVKGAINRVLQAIWQDAHAHNCIMENKSTYTYTREQIDSYAGRPITDKEWEVVSSELDSSLDYYFGEELNRIWDNIDHLVSEAE